jgi:hypothetical protein
MWRLAGVPVPEAFRYCCLQQVEALLPGELIYSPIDARCRSCSGASVKEIRNEEINFPVRHDARTHWSPEMLEGKTRQLLRSRTLGQSASGFRGVEINVAAFLLHDPFEQLPQGRMLGTFDQSCIASLRRPLVDGTPGHVQGDKGLTGEGGRTNRAECRDCLLASALFPQGGDAGRTCLFPVHLKHLANRLAVPHLLEDPAGEERGDSGVLMGGRKEEIPQIADRVMLYVVHVAQRPESPRGQRLIFEVVKVNAFEAEPPGSFLVGIDGGTHDAIYSVPLFEPDESRPASEGPSDFEHHRNGGDPRRQ